MMGVKPRVDLEAIFARDIRAIKLPEATREFKFHPSRKWRFDFAWPDRKIAVEIDGGTGNIRGRHVRPAGFRSDCKKNNAATLLGWRILRGDSTMVRDGSLLAFVEKLLQAEGCLETT